MHFLDRNAVISVQNIQQQLESLKKKRDDLKGKIAEINNAGEGAWQDLKAGADLAWEAMNQAVRSAVSRFKS